MYIIEVLVIILLIPKSSLFRNPDDAFYQIFELVEIRIKMMISDYYSSFIGLEDFVKHDFAKKKFPIKLVELCITYHQQTSYF